MNPPTKPMLHHAPLRLPRSLAPRLSFYFPFFFIFLLLPLATACTPSDHLLFPAHPTSQSPSAVVFDTDHNTTADFALLPAAPAHPRGALVFDDDEDGTPDRLFDLHEYADRNVPHLVVLLDSIPFEALRQRHAADPRMSVFAPPVKIIAPYPSMSAVCFSDILHAPPMPGPINRHYDPRPQHRAVNNLISRRLGGYRNPWQQRLHYNIAYRDNTNAFLSPHPWMKTEFERARRAFDDSPDRTTFVYISSTASMLFKYGPSALDEIFDELNRFVAQVLYERRGAVKISVVSDHGHNLRKTRWVDIETHLETGGFNVTKKPQFPEQPNDVFLEQDGLLTWFGVHTVRPVRVADHLLNLPELETVAYMQGPDVIVRSANGAAVIAKRDHQLTYTPTRGNPLAFPAELHATALSADDWLQRTVDLEFPDGAVRLWDAFHGGTRQAPQVMATLKDGTCAGIGWFLWFVDPHSTHGGLNQINSATGALTMTRRLDGVGPLRSHEVLDHLLPDGPPRIVSESQE